MKRLYSISTTIPLDVNGNPCGPGYKPTTAEILTTSALLNRFLGSRFVVDEEGWVQKLLPHESSDARFMETINFDPVTSCDRLLYLVLITELTKIEPRLAIKYQGEFFLQGVGTLTEELHYFGINQGTIRKR